MSRNLRIFYYIIPDVRCTNLKILAFFQEQGPKRTKLQIYGQSFMEISNSYMVGFFASASSYGVYGCGAYIIMQKGQSNRFN